MGLPAKDQHEREQRNKLLRFVMLAVALWGSTIAIGTSLFGIDPITRTVRFMPSVLRGCIAFAFVAAFMGLWILALGVRKSK